MKLEILMIERERKGNNRFFEKKVNFGIFLGDYLKRKAYS